jgi:hypothetical protein
MPQIQLQHFVHKRRENNEKKELAKAVKNLEHDRSVWFGWSAADASVIFSEAVM